MGRVTISTSLLTHQRRSRRAAILLPICGLVQPCTHREPIWTHFRCGKCAAGRHEGRRKRRHPKLRPGDAGCSPDSHLTLWRHHRHWTRRTRDGESGRCWQGCARTRHGRQGVRQRIEAFTHARNGFVVCTDRRTERWCRDRCADALAHDCCNDLQCGSQCEQRRNRRLSW
jgi:hypothetical protein